MHPQIVPTKEPFVVDDDEVMRETLSVVFTLAGYRRDLCRRREVSSPAARVHPPTAVLLDLNPPDKSGLVVLKEIDAQNYPAPIFIISGDGDIAHAVAAAANGSVAFDLRRSTRH
jgi:DNA-binding response OmpR family regulator